MNLQELKDSKGKRIKRFKRAFSFQSYQLSHSKFQISIKIKYAVFFTWELTVWTWWNQYIKSTHFDSVQL